MSQPVTLTIIIVNWNGKGFLPQCLKSIGDNPPCVPYEVIVIDNMSTDGSREWLLSREAESLILSGAFRTILSVGNLGFGRANNCAVLNSMSEYVFFLNPDTLLGSGSIDRLLAVASRNESIGAVAPKILNSDGTLQPSVAYFPPNPFVIAVTELSLATWFPLGFRKRFFAQHWRHDEERAVPMVWGAALLVKRSVIDKIGGFDEDFFMYGEDLELCARIQRSGWKIVFVPKATVTHFGGKSSEQVWSSDESELKKYNAAIMAERKALSRTLATSNALTRLSLHSLVYLKRAVFRQEIGSRKRKLLADADALRRLFVG
jgi:GT2 family glycosyltransferase